MTEREIINQLQRLVRDRGSQKAASEHLGVSLSYLNDVINGRRRPGAAILKALGLRKGYERA